MCSWKIAFLKMHCQFGNNGDSLTEMFSLFWRIPFQGWSIATMSHRTFWRRFFSLQSNYQCVQPVSKIKECYLAFFRRINQTFWMQYWSIWKAFCTKLLKYHPIVIIAHELGHVQAMQCSVPECQESFWQEGVTPACQGGGGGGWHQPAKEKEEEEEEEEEEDTSLPKRRRRRTQMPTLTLLQFPQRIYWQGRENCNM